jgi:hypothetical protein
MSSIKKILSFGISERHFINIQTLFSVFSSILLSVVNAVINSNTTFQQARKFEGVRKFLSEKQSYTFVYALI